MLLHVFLYLVFGALFVAYTVDLKKFYGIQSGDGKLELAVSTLLWPVPLVSGAVRRLLAYMKKC